MAAEKLTRSAGVLTPLFSVYSRSSIGTGEIPDIRLLVDWCRKAGLSLIQLLPMNDAGFNFRPYDSESSMALEPFYLSIDEIAHVDTDEFKSEIAALRKKYPCEGDYFDTSVKKAKLDLLWYMYRRKKKSGDKDFAIYAEQNRPWLEPYAQYKVLKDRFGLSGWMSWPEDLKNRNPDALAALEKDEHETLVFYQWLQWQLYLQFSEAKKYARKNGVRIVGDIPFLVSRDSADVWARPSYFKLHLSSGAPPDMYFAAGQEWGMPPADWEEIERHDYDYLTQKLKYAENFYDLFRIDHFVGVFRVWTFQRGLPDAERAKTAAFDPPDESVWEEHGRKIVEAMLRSTSMRPCAEDLGCVPKCSDRVLEDYGIPGMEVQRWMRHWETTGEYKRPEEYRENAIAVISTHDTSPLEAWWKWEAGSDDDRQKFWAAAGLTGKFDAEPTQELIDACFDLVSRSRSVFSIQLIQDWFSYGGLFKDIRKDYRINMPGIVHDKNWRLRLPLSLEQMLKSPLHRKIAALNRSTRRIG